MILGLSLSTFVLVHVIISLIGIGSGVVVVFGLLTAKRLDGWTAVFLASTLLTSRSRGRRGEIGVTGLCEFENSQVQWRRAGECNGARPQIGCAQFIAHPAGAQSLLLHAGV